MVERGDKTCFELIHTTLNGGFYSRPVKFVFSDFEGYKCLNEMKPQPNKRLKPQLSFSKAF